MERSNLTSFGPARRSSDELLQAALEELTATLVALVPVHGRVTFPDGPAGAGIEVRAIGAGHGFDDFRTTGRTDEDGSFELKIAADMYYQFVAGSDEWAAPSQARIVRAGAELPDLASTLRPATRVHGRITVGSEREPLANQYVALYQRPDREYYELPQDERLPNPKDSRTAVTPSAV